ncbi:hypothetical protein HNQ51_003127 [Inhella inkyongensis]|uniref:Uncharacterized protein n=1 Tax=Inhella inkyongensis TaxID=392593 RepID=A0A840SBS8_9BURK|nr:hypothetical protein [Inhella inkyongensis]MBB5205800.1 hypothetical protein [Inhella inkyongensis]
MNRFFKFIGWTALVVLLASLVMGGVLMGLAHEGLFNSGWGDAGSWHVLVDGEEWTGDVHEFGFFGGLLGLLALGFTLVVVLPLTLILGVGLPLLLTFGALALVGVLLVGLSALVASPLLLPILLLVWLLKPKKPAASA